MVSCTLDSGLLWYGPLCVLAGHWCSSMGLDLGRMLWTHIGNRFAFCKALSLKKPAISSAVLNSASYRGEGVVGYI